VSKETYFYSKRGLFVLLSPALTHSFTVSINLSGIYISISVSISLPHSLTLSRARARALCNLSHSCTHLSFKLARLILRPCV